MQIYGVSIRFCESIVYQFAHIRPMDINDGLKPIANQLLVFDVTRYLWLVGLCIGRCKFIAFAERVCVMFSSLSLSFSFYRNKLLVFPWGIFFFVCSTLCSRNDLDFQSGAQLLVVYAYWRVGTTWCSSCMCKHRWRLICQKSSEYSTRLYVYYKLHV